MIAEVIVARRTPISLPYFDYEVPKNLEEKVKVGQLVEVELRKSVVHGVIRKIKKSNTEKNLKPIISVFFNEPVLSEPQLDFLFSIHQLYHVSLGFLLKKNLLPLQKTKLKKIELKKLNKKTKQNNFAEDFFVYNNKKDLYKLLYKKNGFIPPKAGHKLILFPEVNNLDEIYNNLSAQGGPLQPGGQAASGWEEELKKQVIVISSDTSEKELFEAWVKIRTGEKKIVLGTRRALFLPWDNLKQIIMLDEGSFIYKSWDMAPRFHTRDAVRLLAKFHNSQVIFASHSPSVDVFYHAIKNKSKELKKIKPLHFENCHIKNMKDERKKGNFEFLCEDVLEKIRQLADDKNNKKDILLFLNRKGEYKKLFCKDCGEIIKCSRCQGDTNLHLGKKISECLHCGKIDKLDMTCPNCKGFNLVPLGMGIKQMEKEIKKIIKKLDVEVVRVDSDLKPEVYLKKLKSKNKKIIIGTQMALSLIDYNNLSDIVLVDVDMPLFVPEFKIVEEAWQLLRKILFDANIDTSVFIQTNFKEHYLFKSFFNPLLFYKTELNTRKEFIYPPYSFLLKLSLGEFKTGVAIAKARVLVNKLETLTKAQKNIKIFGPLSSVPDRAKNRFWQIILVKFIGEKTGILEILNALPDGVKVDSNPNNIMSSR